MCAPSVFTTCRAQTLKLWQTLSAVSYFLLPNTRYMDVFGDASVVWANIRNFLNIALQPILTGIQIWRSKKPKTFEGF